MCDYVSKKVLNAKKPHLIKWTLCTRASTLLGNHQEIIFWSALNTVAIVMGPHAEFYCEVYEHGLCQEVEHQCRSCKEAHDQKLDNKHQNTNLRVIRQEGVGVITLRSLNTSTETLL